MTDGTMRTEATPLGKAAAVAAPLHTAGDDPAATLATSAAGLRRAAACASVLAGLLHFAVVPDHRAEWWLYAVFFTVLGAFQIMWSALAWLDDQRSLWWLGLLINAGTLALWLVSRTTGLPFSPGAGEAEGVGVFDTITCVAELVTIALLLVETRLYRREPAVTGAEPGPRVR